MRPSTAMIVALSALALLCASCQKGEVNPPMGTLGKEVKPVDINQSGFELLEMMQGHWVGSNKVLSWEWDWFAFDYRPISASHILGIHEGGTLGNLLTSFFVSDYKGKRTIMARNGGVLSGLYRTSYFVLDSVKKENGVKYFRLVDAIGGANTMFMELRFKGDSLKWEAFTSRLGENTPPNRHFSFNGSKRNLQLAAEVAKEVDFPQNVPAWDFSNGFREDYLYVIPDLPQAKSATFLAQANNNNDVFRLANESGDPFRIQDHPHVASLEVNIRKNRDIRDDRLFVYLSFESLTDEQGALLPKKFESLLQFPDISSTQDNFLFTYLHPGEYFLTVIADHNGDGIPGEGDITHVSEAITIRPEAKQKISINNINIQN